MYILVFLTPIRQDFILSWVSCSELDTVFYYVYSMSVIRSATTSHALTCDYTYLEQEPGLPS